MMFLINQYFQMTKIWCPRIYEGQSGDDLGRRRRERAGDGGWQRGGIRVWLPGRPEEAIARSGLFFVFLDGFNGCTRYTRDEILMDLFTGAFERSLLAWSHAMHARTAGLCCAHARTSLSMITACAYARLITTRETLICGAPIWASVAH
jgi:hypothetical protein